MKNQVFNEDCLDTMRRMPDGYIDLVVTSPPYDKVRDYGGHAEFDFENIAKELYRVLKDGGILVWVVADQTKDMNESGTSFRHALYFKSIGFLLNDTMIYHRSSRPGRFPRYYQAFEYMFVLSKGKPKTLNLIADKRNRMVGRTLKDTNPMRKAQDKPDTTMVEYTCKSHRVRDNVWYYEQGYNRMKDNIKYQHPATFPNKLAADHIKSWSNVGEIVYDPFAGSGTTLKMAASLNRKFIGSEINEDYVKIIRKWLHMDEQKLEDYVQ